MASPSISETTRVTGKDLIAGSFPVMTERATVKSGNNLVVGTPVAKRRIGSLGTALQNTAGNSANGSSTGTLAVGTKSQVGTYKIVLTAKDYSGSEGAATFTVLAPNGNIVAVVKEGVSLSDSATNGHFSGVTLTAGSMAIGDSFKFVVNAGDGKLVAWDGSGSYDLFGVLAEDADATSADVGATVYVTGALIKNYLNLPSDATLKAQVIAELRNLNIYCVEAV